jgi:hypothetical protein
VISTTDRVATHTSRSVNSELRRVTESRIAYYAGHGKEIDRRLQELDREWDIERTLEANAATLALSGVLLGAFVDRRWLLLPAGVTAFLLQHAVQGWCPPLPLLRRLGFRTAREIGRERVALKVLRGDFAAQPDAAAAGSERAARALSAAEA